MDDRHSSNVDVLLVEDSPDDAVLIQLLLKESRLAEFNVTWVDHLSEAIDCINRHRYDLVLLDLSLPDSHGLDTVTHVHEEMPNLPIVVLTGSDDEIIGMEAVQAGAQDYLVKGELYDNHTIRIIRYAVERQRIVTRLRDFDRLKSEFLATASHEMRTPLTVIREFVSLVSDEVCGPISEEQRRCLAIVQRHCDRMTGLLNNLLDLKKIESGHISLRRIKADLSALLVQAHTDFLPTCQSKSQQLVLDIADKLPVALIDVQQIHQALVNLLGNANKFTPVGGTITIRARIEKSHIKIEIHDTGKGIRTKDLDTIFAEFRQVEREEGPGVHGTGLGLTITRVIVERHDGEIGVTSEYGIGSVFHITVPVWTDSAEMLAYVSDRLREAYARKAPCSLLLLRVHPHQDGAMLDRVMKAVNPALCPSDSGLLSREYGCIAYVLESEEQGVTSALERLASGSIPDSPEYAVRKMTTAQDAIAWIKRGPGRWSSLRDLIEETDQIRQPAA
jgi:signal transduction histidine kinase